MLWLFVSGCRSFLCLEQTTAGKMMTQMMSLVAGEGHEVVTTHVAANKKHGKMVRMYTSQGVMQNKIFCNRLGATLGTS